MRPKTVEEYRKISSVYLKPWLDVPVTELAARHAEIKALHATITREGFDTSSMKGRGYRPQKKGSPYAANGMVRGLGAVYNTARTDWADLKLAEFAKIRLNKEKPRDKHVETKQLPEWYAAVTAFRTPEPIKADAILLTMFTAIRLNTIKQLKWRDIVLDEPGEERFVCRRPQRWTAQGLLDSAQRLPDRTAQPATCVPLDARTNTPTARMCFLGFRVPTLILLPSATPY